MYSPVFCFHELHFRHASILFLSPPYFPSSLFPLFFFLSASPNFLSGWFSRSLLILSFSAIMASAVASSPRCFGENGTITVLADGGTGPYTYSVLFFLWPCLLFTFCCVVFKFKCNGADGELFLSSTLPPGSFSEKLQDFFKTVRFYLLFLFKMAPTKMAPAAKSP